MIRYCQNKNYGEIKLEKQISLEQIEKFSEVYNINKENKIIEKAITKDGIEKVCIERNVIMEN